jgi:hypothetical protein
MASAQGRAYTILSFNPAPAAGATTYVGASWFFTDGLPDASKGDSVFIYQRSAHAIGSGDSAASVRTATRYARRTDLTAVEGGPAIDVALGAAVPQTGSIRVDARYSQFAALSSQIHPGAVPSQQLFPDVSVTAVPRSVTWPDMPFLLERTAVFRLTSLTAIQRDVDYGTFQYGEFLDSSWKTFRFFDYGFDVTPPVPGGVWQRPPIIVDILSSSDAAGPIVPVVGPPTAPRIEGRDAFAAQGGVGLQPTISWSAPALGSATSYQLRIERVNGYACVLGEEEVRVVQAEVFSRTSFKIPPGFLKAGGLYSAVITARSAPWDTGDHPPFRTGVPLHTAPCVLGIFTP